MSDHVGSGPSDRDLLDRHLAGDRTAFGELVRRHQDRLWAVALRTLRDPDEAADALQDGLLSAFRAAASFRGEAAVTTWLHRIVVNACLDRMRRRQARPTVPLPPDDLAPAATDELGRLELAADLEAALARLPDEQRVPVVLVDVYGYPVDEVARLLEVPSGTIKSRCARGRARLAGWLAGPPASARPAGGNPAPVNAVRLKADGLKADGLRAGRLPPDSVKADGLVSHPDDPELFAARHRPANEEVHRDDPAEG